MERYIGKAASPGIAIGPVFELIKDNSEVCKKHVEQTGLEIARFEKARNQAILQLKDLYMKAADKAGEDMAAVFEAHQMLLEDVAFCNLVNSIIYAEKVNAEYAVVQAAKQQIGELENLEDDYIKERIADIKDIAERVQKILCNCESEEVSDKLRIIKPSIIVAEDLSPSEAVLLDRKQVLALVTRKGSFNSHTAILARVMGIPAIVNTNIPDRIQSELAIADGTTGEFYLSTAEIDNSGEQSAEWTQLLQAYVNKQKQEMKTKKDLQALKIKKLKNQRGKQLLFGANIGDVKDLDAVLSNGADGIGLFRSEFIFLRSASYPTEEEQFQIYKRTAMAMEGKPVVIRTLDIGSDKKIAYFDLDKEENPALGYRAIRICLQREDIFRTQLRAILRASDYGEISILIPMISSLWEVDRVKALIQETGAQLKQEGISVKKVSVGIMIETPAAALISAELAKKVDFFSIGTNDLTQYTLAVDRQNPKLDSVFDAHHPAVLQLVQMTVNNGHEQGIPVSVCGELAADTEIVRTLVEMGVDELSMSPGMILPVKQALIEKGEPYGNLD